MGTEPFWVGVIINLVLSAAVGFIMKPKKKSLLDVGSEDIIRSTVSPRKIIYGTHMTGGILVYAESSSNTIYDQGDRRNHLHLITVLTGHPVDDIVGVLIDDEYFNISGNGTTSNIDVNYFISGFKDPVFDNQIQIVKNLGWGFANAKYVPIGSETNITEIIEDRGRWGQLPTLMDDILVNPWTMNFNSTRDSNGNYPSGHKLTNCSCVYIKIKYNQEAFTGRPSFKFVIRGARVFDPRITSNVREDPTTWAWSNNPALCILDYLTNTSYGLGAKYTDTFLPEIDIDAFKESADICDELIISGITGEPVPSIPRYTLNACIVTSTKPINIVEDMLATCAGRLRYAQGVYSPYMGKYYFPESDLDIMDESYLAGSLDVRTGPSRQEKFNKISGTYTKPAIKKDSTVGSPTLPLYEADDFPLVDPKIGGVNPYETEDGEELIYEVEFPFITDIHQAQRVARIELERNRNSLQLSFKANLKALKFSVGDVIYFRLLDDSKYVGESFFNIFGWDSTVQNLPHTPFTAYYKQFRILSMYYNEDNTIDMTLQEEAPEIYDWNEGDAFESDYAPNSSIIARTELIINPPVLWATGLDTITESVKETLDGYNIITRLYWEAPERVTVAEFDTSEITGYELQYGVIDNPGAPAYADRVSSWSPVQTISADRTKALQGPYIFADDLIKDGTTAYDIRMRSKIFTNRVSPWTYLTEQYTDNSDPLFSSGYIVSDNAILPPEIVSVKLLEIVAAPDYYTVEIAYTTNNALIAGWDRVEVLVCARDPELSTTDPNQVTPDDYDWVDEDSTVYQARINNYERKIPSILSMNTVKVLVPVYSGARQVGLDATNFYRAIQPIYLWARLVMKNGRFTDWTPTWIPGSSIITGSGPHTPTCVVSAGINLIDNDLSFTPLVDRVEGGGGGSGPNRTGTAANTQTSATRADTGVTGVSRSFDGREINVV